MSESDDVMIDIIGQSDEIHDDVIIIETHNDIALWEPCDEEYFEICVCVGFIIIVTGISVGVAYLIKFIVGHA